MKSPPKTEYETMKVLREILLLRKLNKLSMDLFEEHLVSELIDVITPTQTRKGSFNVKSSKKVSEVQSKIDLS